MLNIDCYKGSTSCLHGGSCNRYQGDGWNTGTRTEIARDKNAEELKMFNHVTKLSFVIISKFHDRFLAHHNSQKLESSLEKSVLLKMQLAQTQSNISWIDVQFLKTAFQTLVDARSTVKWTYVFAYFLQKNLHSEIFGGNQRDLEFAVEKLSKILESDYEQEGMQKIKEGVINCNVYLNKRLESLLEDTKSGLLEKRYEFSNTLMS